MLKYPHHALAFPLDSFLFPFRCSVHPRSTLSQAKEVVEKLCIGLAVGRALKAVTVRKAAGQVRQVDGV